MSMSDVSQPDGAWGWRPARGQVHEGEDGDWEGDPEKVFLSRSDSGPSIPVPACGRAFLWDLGI